MLSSFDFIITSTSDAECVCVCDRVVFEGFETGYVAEIALEIEYVIASRPRNNKMCVGCRNAHGEPRCNHYAPWNTWHRKWCFACMWSRDTARRSRMSRGSRYRLAIVGARLARGSLSVAHAEARRLL